MKPLSDTIFQACKQVVPLFLIARLCSVLLCFFYFVFVNSAGNNEKNKKNIQELEWHHRKSKKVPHVMVLKNWLRQTSPNKFVTKLLTSTNAYVNNYTDII